VSVRASHGAPAPARAWLLIGWLFAAPVSGQEIRGILSEREAYEPIALGTVTLVTSELDTLSWTLTDRRGFFRFDVPEAGGYYLIATALGYRAVRSELVEVVREDPRIVEITMVARPIPVEGVLVEARAEEPEVAGLAGTGFYERAAGGRGEFIYPGQIVASEARYTQALFWGLKTVRVHQMSHDRPGPWNDVLVIPNPAGPGYCAPSLYIDGIWVRELNPGESLADAVPKESLQAAEVYVWPFGVPWQYRGQEGCGVILFWTDRRPS